MKREVAADIRAIFNAPDREQAEILLCKTVDKYAQCASKLADWLEGNLPEGLTVFAFPEEHRRRIRTVNSLERVSLEIRRRTRSQPPGAGLETNPSQDQSQSP
jgi:putative transposase